MHVTVVQNKKELTIVSPIEYLKPQGFSCIAGKSDNGTSHWGTASASFTKLSRVFHTIQYHIPRQVSS